MTTLPRHLQLALNRSHAAGDVALLVAQFEAHGVAVKIVRVQLGDPKAEGFGQSREIYRTRTEVTRDTGN